MKKKKNVSLCTEFVAINVLCPSLEKMKCCYLLISIRNRAITSKFNRQKNAASVSFPSVCLTEETRTGLFSSDYACMNRRIKYILSSFSLLCAHFSKTKKLAEYFQSSGLLN